MGGVTAACMFMKKSVAAKYFLRSSSEFTSHPITWFTSATLHASWLHLACNSICGYSLAREMKTVNAMEMFTLGVLWCGCFTTFETAWGLTRSIVVVGSSGNDPYIM